MPVSDPTRAQPWGHKITVSIYISGDLTRAETAAECVAGQVLVPTAEFVGVAVSVVQNAPTDQVAS